MNDDEYGFDYMDGFVLEFISKEYGNASDDLLTLDGKELKYAYLKWRASKNPDLEYHKKTGRKWISTKGLQHWHSSKDGALVCEWCHSINE